MNRPALNMQSILAEDEASTEENWMLSYIDVFVLMTTLFIVLMVFQKPVETEALESEPDQQNLIELAPDNGIPAISTEDWNKAMLDAIEKHQLHDLVNLNAQDKTTELDIASRVLFHSGEAELTRAGEAVLNKLVPVLKATEGIIYVEGHTDDNPIDTPKFPSNWELASARATQVLQYFVSEGMSKDRFRAVSYADTKPLVLNNSVQNRKRNRRVSLVIQREL